MTKENVLKFIVCLTLVFFTSCVKDLDFDQAKNLEISPTFVVSLAYTKLDQTTFVNASGTEITRITDTSNFFVFENSVTKDLVKIDIDFEIDNPFDRKFTLDFKFLDESGIDVYNVRQIAIPENTMNYKFEEEIDLSIDNSILNSKKIEVILELLPSSDGSVININERKVFSFKSAGTFYFKIK